MSYIKNHSKSDYLVLVASMVSKYKKRSYELMRIRLGDKVLDVGCGPATDTIDLAALVGEAGQVVGVDIAEEHIMQARQKAADAGVERWVVHQLIEGHQLPLDTGYFDSVRSERVFQHAVDSNRLLGEMIRVTKVGGWIVVFDTDWSTMSIDTEEIEIEQKIKKFHVEKSVKNGFSGRQLYRMFRESGLQDPYIEVAPTFLTDYQISRQVAYLDATEKAALDAGVITPNELEKWHADLEQLDSENKYFAVMLQVMVAGRKN